MKKKLFFLVIGLFLFLTAQQAFAYVSETPLVEELKERDWQGGSHAFYNVTKITESLTALIIGTSSEEVNQKIQGFSAVHTMSNLIGAMYSYPPASSVEYFADLGKRLNIARPAYAQGVGFEGLEPILPIWRAFRNVSYLFFTIAFVIMGFAIMFRVKLDPQTVISIQNALPRIIIALVLVTFSYAIAGLLIDLIYVIIGLIVTVLTGPAPLLPSEQIKDLQEQMMSGGPTEAAASMFATGIDGIINLGKAFFVQSVLIGGIIGAVVGGLASIPLGGVGALPGAAAGATIGAATPAAIVILVISVAILYALFKLFFILLKAYIGIIISIIFAPFQIMIDVFPGQSGFGNWLRGLVANLAVFPAVAGMLILGRVLSKAAGQGLWSPPLTWAGATDVIQTLISIGIILMIPGVAEMIKNTLQIKPSPFGTALGESFKPVATIGKGAFFYGAESGIERIEEQYRGSGEQKGIGLAAARATRRLLGLKGG